MEGLLYPSEKKEPDKHYHNQRGGQKSQPIFMALLPSLPYASVNPWKLKLLLIYHERL